MYGAKYRGILSGNLLASGRTLKMGREWVFQNDSNPKHKSTKEWLKKKHINVTERTSESTNFNSFENLRRGMKIRVAQTTIYKL